MEYVDKRGVFMNNVMDLGLEYVVDTSGYDALQAQIYEYYGAAGILGTQIPAPYSDFDFPEPLWACGADFHFQPGLESSMGKEHFFKHMLHTDAKTLLPYVDRVLAAEFEGSPIFAASANLEIDRESVAQIVDRAYHMAKTDGILIGPQTVALLNALVLAELLVWRI